MTGNDLRALMTKHRKTQKEVATCAGVSVRRVQQWTSPDGCSATISGARAVTLITMFEKLEAAEGADMPSKGLVTAIISLEVLAEMVVSVGRNPDDAVELTMALKGILTQREFDAATRWVLLDEFTSMLNPHATNPDTLAQELNAAPAVMESMRKFLGDPRSRVRRRPPGGVPIHPDAAWVESLLEDLQVMDERLWAAQAALRSLLRQRKV